MKKLQSEILIDRVQKLEVLCGPGPSMGLYCYSVEGLQAKIVRIPPKASTVAVWGFSGGSLNNFPQYIIAGPHSIPKEQA